MRIVNYYVVRSYRCTYQTRSDYSVSRKINMFSLTEGFVHINISFTFEGYTRLCLLPGQGTRVYGTKSNTYYNGVRGGPTIFRKRECVIRG